MNIAYVMPFYTDPDARPETLLKRYPIIEHLPAEVAALGHSVRFLHNGASNAHFRRGRVTYEFSSPGRPVIMGGQLLHRFKPRYGPAYYQLIWRIALRLRRLRPDIIHFFGLTLDIQLALVAEVSRYIGSQLFVHFHGGVPSDSRKLKSIQRHNLRWVDKLLVTTVSQADPWIEAGLVNGCNQIAQVLETSSPFKGVDRGAARAKTGMTGDPVCLSAGRLHAVKDPMTTLRGFELIAARRPDARLYLYYLTDELLPNMKDYLASRPNLAARIEFRGRAEYAEMEAVYSSADFLFQSSVREWSGLAVIEAMSCGCIPVVTDIPSFRMMTRDGRYGRLFDRGDFAGLATSVLDLNRVEVVELSRDVSKHFQDELSFRAVARSLDILYRRAVETRVAAESHDRESLSYHRVGKALDRFGRFR